MARKSQTRTSGNTQGVPSEGTKNKIPLDELITVMSLIDYPLNLLQQGGGRAKYKFESFGETKEILYEDILVIIENYRSFMEGGYFVILDERVVARHALQSIFSKVLGKEYLERIFQGNGDALAIFNSCNDKQKELVVGMLTRKLARDANSVDLNVLNQISRASGVDIASNADDARELYENNKKGDGS